MATVTRTGARLHTETRVIKRGLAQMSDKDYEVKKCPLCGARIALDSHRKYCRNGCSTIMQKRSHREFFLRVIAANGEWVTEHFATNVLAHLFLSVLAKQFDARIDGCSVSVRKSAA